MLNALKDTGHAVGEFVSDSARSVGGGIATVAKNVGLKRGAIALGIFAGGIGTLVLVRYLRARGDDDETIESNGVRTKKQKRAAKHAQAHAH